MSDKLREELLAMREKDVSPRARLVDRGELNDNEYHPEMRSVHEENNKRITEIIEKFGWPLETEVGEDGSEAVWLIVQHAAIKVLDTVVLKRDLLLAIRRRRPHAPCFIKSF